MNIIRKSLHQNIVLLLLFVCLFVCPQISNFTNIDNEKCSFVCLFVCFFWIMITVIHYYYYYYLLMKNKYDNKQTKKTMKNERNSNLLTTHIQIERYNYCFFHYHQQHYLSFLFFSFSIVNERNSLFFKKKIIIIVDNR